MPKTYTNAPASAAMRRVRCTRARLAAADSRDGDAACAGTETRRALSRAMLHRAGRAGRTAVRNGYSLQRWGTLVSTTGRASGRHGRLDYNARATTPACFGADPPMPETGSP